MLAVTFSLVVRARGIKDRRQLLDMLNEGDYIWTWAHDPNKTLYGRAEDLADDFWKHFVIDGSSPPEADLDHWNAGQFW